MCSFVHTLDQGLIVSWNCHHHKLDLWSKNQFNWISFAMSLALQKNIFLRIFFAMSLALHKKYFPQNILFLDIKYFLLRFSIANIFFFFLLKIISPSKFSLDLTFVHSNLCPDTVGDHKRTCWTNFNSGFSMQKEVFWELAGTQHIFLKI